MESCFTYIRCVGRDYSLREDSVAQPRLWRYGLRSATVEKVISGCVWLIGGTSESALLAERLAAAGLPFVVTVATASAQGLYAETAPVFVGALSASEMAEFVQKWRVRCILDASHPFADRVSRQAIALMQSWNNDPNKNDGIDYIRYERIAISSCSQSTVQKPEDNVIYVDSLDNLTKTDILHHQRVLFTVGYRYLAQFAPLRQTSVLFARVLPSVEAISGAIAAGFSSKEMIALRPPVSPAVETALWQQWNITCVVAKASGTAGGEETKRAIAAKLGTQLILVNRPQLMYPNQTNSIPIAIEFCLKALSLY